ncbi:hypothetical protein [Roseiflexus sp.]|uniref:hypothetical protein n=1 Tax=Roseiflexus sp. TaxID=2562120 RepID=UPI00398B58F4
MTISKRCWVQNSPFSVFNGDERLEYRIDPAEAAGLKPGIVRSLPQGDQLGVIELCEEAKIGAYYDDSDQNVLHGNWRCGEEAFAIIGRDENNVPKVEVLKRRREAFPDTVQPIHGWVKKTGRTIETKRNESFFFFNGFGKEVFFDAEREADFNTILYAQLHERSEDFHTEVQSKRLAPGHLVYVELERDNKCWVRNIALVPDGKNFEWFVANKVKSKKLEKAGPNVPLADPGQAEALPLLSSKTQ